MAKLDFVKPTDKLIQHIADNMRQDDIDEVLAAGNSSPHSALLNSIQHSKAVVVATYNGEPLVVYGLVKQSILGSKGVIWMLGTDEATKFKREFMVYTKQVLHAMFEECDLLMNYVYTGNEVSIKWLRVLGFTIEEPMPHGPNNALFHKFYLKRENYV